MFPWCKDLHPSHLPERDGSLPLVRRTVRSKSNEKFHDSKGVSYSTMRDEFRKFLKPFVSEAKACIVLSLEPHQILGVEKLEILGRSVFGARVEKSGPLERARLASQIQGFRIPDN